ncbi:hypothetical protein HYQ46_004969 [Verticillium longisporum]|nr:hypothetical protein HYQ44_000399 [Verticillium longisporum]KAG7146243.1 hypothetical protein HYQ46_004969 [Verticillium longisporum]
MSRVQLCHQARPHHDLAFSHRSSSLADNFKCQGTADRLKQDKSVPIHQRSKILHNERMKTKSVVGNDIFQYTT